MRFGCRLLKVLFNPIPFQANTILHKNQAIITFEFKFEIEVTEIERHHTIAFNLFPVTVKGFLVFF